MGYREIARALKTTERTVMKAVKHYREEIAPARYSALYSKPVYVQIAEQAAALRRKGFSYRKIGKALNTDYTTARSAIMHYINVIAPDSDPALYIKPDLTDLPTPKYVLLSEEAGELRRQGMNYRDIAARLWVGFHTAMDAVKHYAETHNEPTLAKKRHVYRNRPTAKFVLLSEKALELRKQGIGYAKMCQELKASKSTLLSAVRYAKTKGK